MPGMPRTARPGGAQKIEAAQSTLLVGPSGYALPIDTDETLVVRDLNLDPALAGNIGNQLAVLIQLMRANNKMLFLLCAKIGVSLGVDIDI